MVHQSISSLLFVRLLWSFEIGLTVTLGCSMHSLSALRNQSLAVIVMFSDFISTHSKHIVIISDTKLNRGFYSMEHEKPDNLILQFQ